MNSFILISNDPKIQNEYIQNFVTTHLISPFDITRITEEASVGIEAVRQIQEKLFFKPYRGKEKIIVIDNAEKLTIEAQNAMLKLLEEPPLFVYIFLLATNEDIFLPTILSRCKVIQLSASHLTFSDEEKGKLMENYALIQSGSIAEKLALAEKISSDKELLSRWFVGIITFLREAMLNNPSGKESLHYSQLLTLLQDAHKTFSTTNVSPRSILEHTLLTMQQ